MAAGSCATIKFTVPTLVSGEIRYMLQAVESGHLHGDGPFTARCSALIESVLGCPKVLMNTSCTHALELSSLLLDLKPGDEVIIPSFTFVSTATAAIRAGARLVFVDIRSDTLNLNEALLEAAITPRTRAIIPVHYGGVGCEMDAISEIASRHNLVVIEDSAHAIFGKYKGKYLGTFGAMGCLSFHGTKNFTCGEGGALLLNDPAYIDRAEIIREKGTNRKAFFEGKVEKYTWVDIGSSYLPSDLLAAFLLAQLEARDQIQDRRSKLWYFYFESLKSLQQRYDIGLPVVPLHCEQTFHLFYLMTRSSSERSALLRHMRARGIECTFHYQPLHSSEAGLKFGRSVDGCPVTVDISQRLIRLPLHLALTEGEQERVVEALEAFYRENR